MTEVVLRTSGTTAAFRPRFSGSQVSLGGCIFPIFLSNAERPQNIIFCGAGPDRNVYEMVRYQVCRREFGSEVSRCRAG